MEILRRHNLHYSNGATTPFPSDIDFSLSKPHDVPLSKSAHALYRASIGELLYLAVCTRPDVSFAVSYLARAVHKPSGRHALLLKRVLRYLSGTVHLYIKYCVAEEGNDVLEAYSDADWAGCRDTRKSSSGFLICFSTSPIHWKSVK